MPHAASLRAEAIKATMSLDSVMRPVEAASSTGGVSQNEENMEQAEPTDDGWMKSRSLLLWANDILG